MPWKKFTLILAIVVVCALGFHFIRGGKDGGKADSHAGAKAAQAVPVKVARAIHSRSAGPKPCPVSQIRWRNPPSM